MGRVSPDEMLRGEFGAELLLELAEALNDVGMLLGQVPGSLGSCGR